MSPTYLASYSLFSFFSAAATTEIYTLSLHDALPISSHQLRTPITIALGHAELIERRPEDRKSTRLNSSHRCISYAVFCLKKKRTERWSLLLLQPAQAELRKDLHGGGAVAIGAVEAHE